jgi:hypothetical protein
MEEAFRKKALAGLIALIVIFATFSAYIFIIVPEKRPLYDTYMDQGEAVLDSMNYSELVQTFHDSKFLENYTVEPSPDSTDVLVIIPKNYPDLVTDAVQQ